MKGNYILCALSLTALLLGGCAKQQEQITYIGADAAKQLALEDSGLKASGVDSITADLNTRNGMDYYQVELTVEGQNYQYDIDALTGVIIETRSPGGAQGDSLVTDADTYSTSQPSASTPENQQSPGSPADGMITADEAKASALSHAGLTDDQVTFIKSKLDYDNKQQVYNVEFYTQDKEYDYGIDAYTGEVISFDYDMKNGSAPASSGSGAVTADEAKELALAQVPGASASDIREFEVDYDDGRTEYEGKIIYDGMEYEFEIDGYSGAIRSWEAEPARRR